jgi:hypothetical protein
MAKAAAVTRKAQAPLNSLTAALRTAYELNHVEQRGPRGCPAVTSMPLFPDELGP